MLYRISRAVAAPDHSVRLRWEDGVDGVVDFRPIIAKGGVFLPMQDPVFFVREMRIAADGTALEWPDEIDFSADGLRYKAFPADARKDFGVLAAE